MELPLEIVFSIFCLVGPRDVLRHCSRVCVQWHAVAVDPYLWRFFFQQAFGTPRYVPVGFTDWRAAYKHAIMSRRVRAISVVGTRAEELELKKTLLQTFTHHLSIAPTSENQPSYHVVSDKDAYYCFEISTTSNRSILTRSFTRFLLSDVIMIVRQYHSNEWQNEYSSYMVSFLVKMMAHLPDKVVLLTNDDAKPPHEALEVPTYQRHAYNTYRTKFREVSRSVKKLPLVDMLRELHKTLPNTHFRSVVLPPRYVVLEVRRRKSDNAMLVFGRVLAGMLTRGQRVCVAPSGHTAVIRSLEVNREPRSVVVSSEDAGILLHFDSDEHTVTSAGNTGLSRVRRGMVIGPEGPFAPRAASGFTAVLKMANQRLRCRRAQVLVHGRIYDCGVKPAEPFGDTETNVYQFTPSRPVPVELYEQYPQLGTIAILQDAWVHSTGEIISIVFC